MSTKVSSTQTKTINCKSYVFEFVEPSSAGTNFHWRTVRNGKTLKAKTSFDLLCTILDADKLEKFGLNTQPRLMQTDCVSDRYYAGIEGRYADL